MQAVLGKPSSKASSRSASPDQNPINERFDWFQDVEDQEADDLGGWTEPPSWEVPVLTNGGDKTGEDVPDFDNGGWGAAPSWDAPELEPEPGTFLGATLIWVDGPFRSQNLSLLRSKRRRLKKSNQLEVLLESQAEVRPSPHSISPCSWSPLSQERQETKQAERGLGQTSSEYTDDQGRVEVSKSRSRPANSFHTR